MTRICPIALVVLTVLTGCRSTNPRGECLFKLLHRGDFAAAEAFLAKHPARINGEYCDMEDVDPYAEEAIKQAKCSFTKGTPLLYLFTGKPQIIKWLLDHGARIDRQRPLLLGSPLHALGTLRSIMLMIEAARKIGPLYTILNSENTSRKVALYYAILFKNYPVAEYLMKNGADINYSNSGGMTLLGTVVMELGLIETASMEISDPQERIAELKEAATWIRQHGGKFAIELARERVKESDREDELLRKRLSKFLSQKDVDRILGNKP